MFNPTEQKGIYSFGLRYPLPPKDAGPALAATKLKGEIFSEVQNFKAGYMYTIENFHKELDGMRVFVFGYDESQTSDISPRDQETLYLHIARLQEIEPKILIEFTYALVGGEVYERNVLEDMSEERLRLERIYELSGLLSLLKNTSR